MQKVRLNFELDEWLATSLERFSVEHPDLETTKDRVQGYIKSLEEQVSGLEAQVHYLNDVAGKSAEAPLNSSFNQDSSILPTEKESRPTSEPEIVARARADTVQLVTFKGKAYRVRDSQIDSAVWQDGEWTFSRKKAEALALASELDQIKTSGAEKREQIKTAEEGKREQIDEKREQTKTREHETRALVTVNMHRQIAEIHETSKRKTSRQPGQGQIEDGCPHGAPVADMVV